MRPDMKLSRGLLWRCAALAAISLLALVFQTYVAIDLVRNWDKGQVFYSFPLRFAKDSRLVQSLAKEAEGSGIRPGDEVIAIDDMEMRGLSTLARLGPKQATLTLRREEPGKPPVRFQATLPTKKEGFPFSALEQKLLSAVLMGAMPWLCLGLGVWACAIRIRDSQAWLLLALMTSFPHMVNAGVMHWPDGLRQAAIAYKTANITLLAVAMPLFALYFAERSSIDRRLPWLKWLLIVPAVVSGLAIAGRGVLLSDYVSAAPRLLALLEPPADIFGAVLFISIGFFFFAMGLKFGFCQKPDARRRLKLLLYGTQVAMTPMFVLILISLFTGKNVVNVVPAWVLTGALLLIILFPLTITYVIVVHRALDVRVVLRQGIQYTLARGGARILIGLIVVALIVFLSFAIDEQTSTARRMGIIGQGVLIVVLLQRVRVRLASWIDRRFFREAYDAERILNELSEEVRTMVDTDTLLKRVGHSIAGSLFVSRISFLLADGQVYRPAYALGFDAPPDIHFPETAATIQWLKRESEPAKVYFDDAASWVYQTPDMTDAERENLRRLESQLILPLAVKEKLLGFLCLGQKKSEEPYSGSDLRLLRSLATQTGLALENSRLTAAIATEAAQRERLNRELEIAREVQERLFPQKTPSIPGIDCAGGCRPALGVGGDYYDFLQLPEDRLGLVIGDVSGKGIAAALLMASLQASVRGQMMHGLDGLATIVTHVNTLIYEASSSSRYATLFYAQLDAHTRQLDYVNAGHNPPLLMRASGQVESLNLGGTVVGLLPRFPYQQGSVTLHPGDLLVCFTDGISEAQNAAEEEFGEDRLIDAIRRAGNLPAAELIPFLIRETDTFVDGAPQHDDMTLVVLRMLPQSSRSVPHGTDHHGTVQKLP